MTYDVIIIGAGPAGLAAALYAGRAKLSTLLIEKSNDGGQISNTAEIENYPGAMVEGESGVSLTERMTEQAKRFGAERLHDTVTEVKLDGEIKTVTCLSGNVYNAKTIIIAAGANPRPLDCERESEFIGRGISFCATCDAFFFRNKEVYVAGGGDAAIEEAIFLTKFARKVTIVHRRDELRAAKTIQDKAFSNEKIRFIWDSAIVGVGGEKALNRITLKNVKTGEISEITADENDGNFGLFVFLGQIPNTSLFEKYLPLESGYIRTDEEMRTDIPGVFAAGDIRVKSLRQVITAAADGAIAATQVEKYLG